MTRGGQLLLYGVFRRLVECNVRLGVADYLDAIRALKMQASDPALERPPDREALRRVCHILWARGAEEARLIDAIFASIPPPPQRDVEALTNLIQSVSRDRDTIPLEPSLTESGARPTSVEDDQSKAAPQAVRVEIQPPGQAGGVPLPYPVLPALSKETYVMEPQSVVSPRALAVLWRRYRRMVRSGPLTELDIDATIDAQCRLGTIERPVLRAARINRARLLILADVSPSMVPWRPFLEALVRSLALSRLQDARMLYFANVPKRAVFQSPALTGAASAEKLLKAFAGAGLLIFGDGGAARGYFNRQRVAQTTAFVEAARRHTRAVVWVNPMPRSRWTHTSAEAVASSHAATFLPLDVPSLIRAVDILRGAKSH
jgi:uncharacterized protein with von Willebrand factor type A (vWA) domain